MTEATSRRTKASSADGAAPAFTLPAPAQSLAALNAQTAQTAQAMLAAFDIMEANMNAYRGFLDAMRTAVRRQQNAAFSALRTQIAGAAAGVAAPNGAEAATHISGFGAFWAPILAVIDSYEQIGGAVLDAQRQASDAISSQIQAASRPHA